MSRFALYLLGSAALLVAPLADAAERKLAGAEISRYLPAIVALGEQTRQTFSASGATTYTDRGRDSLGSWSVEGDRYCSVWPPAPSVVCYDVVLDEAPADGGKPVLKWIGDSGRETVNRIEPKN